MYVSISKNKGALKVISFQNNAYVSHGQSPSKGTIISKIHTFFYNIKRSVETSSVYILLVLRCYWLPWFKMTKNQEDLIQSDTSLFSQQ